VLQSVIAEHTLSRFPDDKEGAMFALNEKVVYPGHGVARVSRIMERIVGGGVVHFYELKFLNKDMTILVPVDNLSSVGVRALSSQDYIQSVFKTLAEVARKNQLSDVAASSWNKRNKKYQAALRSGNLIELSKIYRDLHHLSCAKELSFGERNLLLQTEALLAEEISMVESVVREDAIGQLRSFFEPHLQRQQKAASSSV